MFQSDGAQWRFAAGQERNGPALVLARYVRCTAFEDLPGQVIHEAKRSLLNWLGVAIGASRHETIEIALRVVAQIGGAPQASILGRVERTDIGHAAFINGMSSHGFDFDDTHLATIIHPTGLEGKFSIFHSAAVALIDGAAGEAQYSNERVLDPTVVELRKRVRATEDPVIPEDAAHLVLTLAGGEGTRSPWSMHTVASRGR